MTKAEKLKALQRYCDFASLGLWGDDCSRTNCILCGNLFHMSRCIIEYPERYNDESFLDESYRIVKAEIRKCEERKANNPFLNLKEEV